MGESVGGSGKWGELDILQISNVVNVAWMRYSLGTGRRGILLFGPGRAGLDGLAGRDQNRLRPGQDLGPFGFAISVVLVFGGRTGNLTKDSDGGEEKEKGPPVDFQCNVLFWTSSFGTKSGELEKISLQGEVKVLRGENAGYFLPIAKFFKVLLIS